MRIARNENENEKNYEDAGWFATDQAGFDSKMMPPPPPDKYGDGWLEGPVEEEEDPFGSGGLITWPQLEPVGTIIDLEFLFPHGDPDEDFFEGWHLDYFNTTASGGADIISIFTDNVVGVSGISTGDYGDAINLEGYVYVHVVDTGSGDDVIDLQDGAHIGDLHMGDGDDTLILEDSDVHDADMGAGDDSVEITGGGYISDLDMGSGEDTLSIELAAGLSDTSHVHYDGGSGDEEEGDTLNITDLGNYQSVTFYPATVDENGNEVASYYVVQFENGSTATFTNFETITWPEDFNEDDIVVFEGEAPPVVDDPVSDLFFDPVTSALMIEEAAAKAAQDDADNVENDIWA